MAQFEAKMSEEQWLCVRREYEAPGANISEIARRYGITRQAVHQRARRGGWAKGQAVEVIPPSPVSGAPVPDDTEDDEVKPSLTDPARVRMLERHQRDWAPVRRKIRAATKGDGGFDNDLLADAMDLTKILVPMQKAEREAYLIGMDFKPPANTQAAGQAVAAWGQRVVDAIGALKVRNEELEQRLAKYEPVEA